MNVLRLFLLGACALAVTAVAAARPSLGQAEPGAECSQTSTELVPLTDLGKRRYKGHRGGLYPGGVNEPPRRYLKVGLSSAKRVGRDGEDVALLSVGMSNATQEFQAFIRIATQDPDVKPSLKLVDGAIGGWDARRMARPRAGYWRALDRRLAAEGVASREVQVVWLKQAISGEDRPFPQDARALRANLRSIVRILARKFPNLRLIYTSSRTYAGYAVTALNPEPAAYDSGFAVRWLVQDRMEKRLRGPWIGWGPYLWTDGTKGRADGFTWTCDDVRRDGTHPSAAGAAKIARQLLQFFKSHPTAKSWFLATP
ncbi:MAG TPA: hypothetical protein VG144_07570 [Gaiellaceae bacterium]|nr:hypothetical protein [Gaiellaceae bacterium]